MAENSEKKKRIFKYNMSFYYQSTIIYFVVFGLYIIIRGEFVENSFKLITKDPIIYFFGMIVLISLVSLLYNLYKNKYMQITDEEISFFSRFKSKSFSIKDIIQVKIGRPKRREKNRAFRLVRIKIANRKRPIIIRPYDYENQAELVAEFQKLKEELERK